MKCWESRREIFGFRQMLLASEQLAHLGAHGLSSLCASCRTLSRAVVGSTLLLQGYRGPRIREAWQGFLPLTPLLRSSCAGHPIFLIKWSCLPFQHPHCGRNGKGKKGRQTDSEDWASAIGRRRGPLRKHQALFLHSLGAPSPVHTSRCKNSLRRPALERSQFLGWKLSPRRWLPVLLQCSSQTKSRLT